MAVELPHCDHDDFILINRRFWWQMTKRPRVQYNVLCIRKVIDTDLVFKLYKLKDVHVFSYTDGAYTGRDTIFSDTTKAITTNSNIYNPTGSYEGKSILLICSDEVFSKSTFCQHFRYLVRKVLLNYRILEEIPEGMEMPAEVYKALYRRSASNCTLSSPFEHSI